MPTYLEGQLSRFLWENEASAVNEKLKAQELLRAEVRKRRASSAVGTFPDSSEDPDKQESCYFPMSERDFNIEVKKCGHEYTKATSEYCICNKNFNISNRRIDPAKFKKIMQSPPDDRTLIRFAWDTMSVIRRESWDMLEEKFGRIQPWLYKGSPVVDRLEDWYRDFTARYEHNLEVIKGFFEALKDADKSKVQHAWYCAVLLYRIFGTGIAWRGTRHPSIIDRRIAGAKTSSFLHWPEGVMPTIVETEALCRDGIRIHDVKFVRPGTVTFELEEIYDPFGNDKSKSSNAAFARFLLVVAYRWHCDVQNVTGNLFPTYFARTAGKETPVEHLRMSHLKNIWEPRIEAWKRLLKTRVVPVHDGTCKFKIAMKESEGANRPQSDVILLGDERKGDANLARFKAEVIDRFEYYLNCYSYRESKLINWKFLIVPDPRLPQPNYATRYEFRWNLEAWPILKANVDWERTEERNELRWLTDPSPIVTEVATELPQLDDAADPGSEDPSEDESDTSDTPTVKG
ncbi:hypothetical protein BJ508DRAFT_314016 [Ascobolus immersus RN42]|uniref:Uncharacterized protein n=1 Tax=Ascobolus immersus RN42 TaxID=1160509 RepID=A0A3N4HMB0_ASCIM|nr:hypothetical protein BJ508DRAFT_314016 [Ascobolus immersus RN42]